MASAREIEWYRGDSYPLEFTISDKATAVAIDLSGYSFTLSVDSKKNPANSDTNIFSVAGVVDADQVANTGKVTFKPTEANADQDPGTNHYDIQMIDGSSNKRTIFKGKWKFVQDITK